MKTFIFLCALVALTVGEEAREKRSFGHGWGGESHGWGDYHHGWDHQHPKTKVIAFQKVVHVPREITVPQVVHVRKVINEPKVIIVKKVVPVEHGHGHHGWW